MRPGGRALSVFLALQSGFESTILLPCLWSFEKDGFRFAFYSNDHRPVHVHVRKGDGEAIFDVENAVELRESAGMKIRDLARAQELAEENRTLIIQKWHEHLA